MSYVRDDQNGSQKSGISPRLIVAGVLGLVALLFVVQNSDRHRVDFLLWDMSAPAWLWMIILLAIGVVIGSIFPWFRRKKDQRG